MALSLCENSRKTEVRKLLRWHDHAHIFILACMMALDWRRYCAAPQVLCMFFPLTFSSLSFSFSLGLFCLFPACTYVVPEQVPPSCLPTWGHWVIINRWPHRRNTSSSPLLPNVTTQTGSLLALPWPFILSGHLRWNICIPSYLHCGPVYIYLSFVIPYIDSILMKNIWILWTHQPVIYLQIPYNHVHVGKLSCLLFF